MTAPARPVVAVLATLDTKAPEAGFLKERIEAQGGQALLVDLGVMGAPGVPPDVTREEVAAAGGTPLAELLAAPTRQTASPVMTAGAAKLLQARLGAGTLHAVLGMGGTQGTSNCAAVMQSLPYGLPKLIVSTVASGDTSAFVGIKDVTMMFSVGDLLGLNPITRAILSNAAGAAVGMARAALPPDARRGDRPLIGMTNLGVLTEGALRALSRFEQRGYEAIVFHGVGSGGRAMERMMQDGLIGAVFDYALGEITDEMYDGLRAAGPERLTVGASLGLPTVLCPGGAEHVGLLVPENTVPERWAGRPHVFHNPIILAPRLSADEFADVAREVGRRLAGARGPTSFLMPMRGTSRYGIAGGPLHDPAGDAAFLAALEESLPAEVRLEVIDAAAEDAAFVDAAVDRLLEQVEETSTARLG